MPAFRGGLDHQDHGNHEEKLSLSRHLMSRFAASGIVLLHSRNNFPTCAQAAPGHIRPHHPATLLTRDDLANA